MQLTCIECTMEIRKRQTAHSTYETRDIINQITLLEKDIGHLVVHIELQQLIALNLLSLMPHAPPMSRKCNWNWKITHLTWNSLAR